MKALQIFLLAILGASLSISASSAKLLVSSIPLLLSGLPDAHCSHTFKHLVDQGYKTKDNAQELIRRHLDTRIGIRARPDDISSTARGLNDGGILGDLGGFFESIGGTVSSILRNIFCFLQRIFTFGIFTCDNDDDSSVDAPPPTPPAAPTSPTPRTEVSITVTSPLRQHVDVQGYTQFSECRDKGYCVPNKYISDHKVVLPREHDGRILQSITIRHTDTAGAYADERFVDQVFIYDVCIYILIAGQNKANISHNNEALCVCGQKGATQNRFPTYGTNNVIAFPGDGLFVPAGAEIRFGVGGAFMRQDGSSDDSLQRYYLGCEKDGYIGGPSDRCHQLAELGNVELSTELYELPLDMADLAVYQMMRVPYVDVFLLNRNSPDEGHNFNSGSEIGAIFEYVSTTPVMERWNSVLYRERNGVVETLLNQQQKRSQPIDYRRASFINGDVPLDLGTLRDLPIAVGDTVGIYCDTLRYSDSITPFNDCAYWVAARVHPKDSSSDAIFRSIDTIRPNDREAFCSVVGPRHSGSPLFTDAYDSKERCLQLLSNEMAVDSW